MASPDQDALIEGERCDLCDEDYRTVYRVPDDIWRRVTDPVGGSLICPRCFDAGARHEGIELYWEAREGGYPTTALESALAVVAAAKEALEKIADSSNHALRAFGDGCVGPITKVRVRGSDPPEYRERCACPVCFARDTLARLSGEDR